MTIGSTGCPSGPAQQGTPEGRPVASPKVRTRIALGIPEMRQGCWGPRAIDAFIGG
jgi:hypothetical protein